jgi:dTDP-glucose 4,6-dehydratase
MVMKILLTGMTGFAGSHLAEHILAATDWKIYSLERGTTQRNLLGCLSQSDRIQRVYHDFRSPLPDRIIKELEGVDYIAHVGAEVHGIRSIEDPELFVKSNVLGTYNLLEAARILQPKKFLYVSSAEAVGGASSPVSYTEVCALRPSNPYSASKAVGEALCRSYNASFKVPTVVVRTMNIFGERQDTSKFVPAVTKKLLRGELITIHIGPDGKSGSRHWLHVREFVKAMTYLLESGNAGEIYHVAGPEKANAEIVAHLAWALRCPARQHFAVPSKTHEMRYSIQDTKIPESVYDPHVGQLGIDLANTALFYKENQEWLQ